MGRYMRRRNGIRGEVAAETETAAANGRKRKDRLGEVEESSVELKTRRLTEDSSSTCDSASSDRCCTASCCSSNGDTSELVDLEQKEEEVLVSSAGDSVDSRERRETTPSSEVRTETGELESTAKPRHRSNSRRRPTPASKMPSEAELEEFFAAAEMNLQKEFIEKYNYDIVKDEPLEGRYEWVEIRP